MNSKEFKKLPQDEQIKIIQTRFAELKEQHLKTADFKNDVCGFSYSFACKVIKDAGYEVSNGIIKKPKKDNTQSIYEYFSHYVSEHKESEIETKSLNIYTNTNMRLNDFCDNHNKLRKVDVLDMLLTYALDTFE